VQVHYGEGVANHTDPESCAACREVCGEALTGERAGQPLSHEIFLIQERRRGYIHGRQNGWVRHRECPNGPAWSETLACTDALCLGTGRSPVWPFAVKEWSVSGRRGAVADDERTGEVRPFHSVR
jgi:hypothetical protein